MKNKSNKTLVVVLLAIGIAGALAIGYYYWKKNKAAASTPVDQPEPEPDERVTVPPTPGEDITAQAAEWIDKLKKAGFVDATTGKPVQLNINKIYQ